MGGRSERVTYGERVERVLAGDMEAWGRRMYHSDVSVEGLSLLDSATVRAIPNPFMLGESVWSPPQKNIFIYLFIKKSLAPATAGSARIML